MNKSIDFERINVAALAALPRLLPTWFPYGRVRGVEFVVGSLQGEQGDSLSINMTSGLWKDFSTDDGGSDPVSLLAAIRRVKQGEAANEIARELGIDPGGNDATPRSRVQVNPMKKAEWTPIMPVSKDAPTPDFKHPGHGQPATIWPYRDGLSHVLGYVCRFEPKPGRKEILPLTYCQGPDGSMSWRWKGFTVPRPLYGLDMLAKAAPDMPVLLVEGEKTADAAAKLVPGAVCMTWPNGSKSVGKADFSPLAGRRVGIWPDADKPGFEAVFVLAERLKAAGAVEVLIITPPDGAVDGWDLADAFAEGWNKEQVAAHITAHRLDAASFAKLAQERYGVASKDSAERKPVAPGGPSPFVTKPDGIYFATKNKDGEDSQEWVCSPLAVLAMTRNSEDREWGRLLEIEDADGHRHRWAMPMASLSGDGNEYRRELLSMGLRLASGPWTKNRLHDYLVTTKPEARARCVNRVGWHGRRFVLPDGVYGLQDGEEVILQGGPTDHAFRVAGDLTDWQTQIGRYCVNNSRLILAVSAAFAAPLLAHAGVESGGFNLVGGSSTGKTTALRVAGSVCGGGGLNGYIRQWRTTDNALESVSSGACDCLLTLDELGQADAKTAGAVAYMLTNGQGKARSRRDGTARKTQEWRTLFLSTGEITLGDKVAEDGRSKLKAGQAVRVVDIQADAGAGLGLFEDIHGFDSPAAFACHMNEQARRVYGSPLRAFLEYVADDYEDTAKAVTGMVQDFVKNFCPSGADAQVVRVAGRFGLLAAGGELGVLFNVLPWPKGEATKAVARCFRDWLDARGGAGAAEVSTGLAQVRQFFQAHGTSRFETWGEAADAKVINRAGFRRKEKDSGEWSFLVFQEVFRGEVCKGHNADMVLRELKERGLLIIQDSKGLTVKPRIPGVGNGTRFYHVAPAILGSDEQSPALQKQVGTSRDGRDTLSCLASDCPYPENERSGQSGHLDQNDRTVPTCPYPQNERSGQWEASNDAVSLLVPNVPTQNYMSQRAQ